MSEQTKLLRPWIQQLLQYDGEEEFRHISHDMSVDVDQKILNKPPLPLPPQLEYKEAGQEYAQVIRMLGNGRCECFCFDGVTRLGHIRGKMRKKVWVTAGGIVLCGLREFQDEKVDIIHKYTADEARNLKTYGELPETARINETAVDLAMEGDGSDDDIGIDFDDI